MAAPGGPLEEDSSDAVPGPVPEVVDVDVDAGGQDAEAPESAEESSEEYLLRAERDEYLGHLRRVQADFENYRKRMLRERSTHLERATEGLVERLLPVLDALELALASGEADVTRLRKGIELVSAQILGVLEREGLERIEAHGKPFDPAEHEAVVLVEAEGEAEGEAMVDDVMRAGYRLKGRVLRPAMVKVAR